MTLTDTAAVRILIVAAYASVRAGLHALLDDAPDYAVIGAVSGTRELESVLDDAAPDIVVCAGAEEEGIRVIEMLGGRSIGLVLLADAAPRLVSLLSAAPLPGYALLCAGADGFALAASVRAVAAGLVVWDRHFAASTPVFARLETHETPGGDALTARERQVLQAMAQGLPNKQIAARLGISPHTAKFHVASILAKLGAATRAEAVTLGARRGDLLL